MIGRPADLQRATAADHHRGDIGGGGHRALLDPQRSVGGECAGIPSQAEDGHSGAKAGKRAAVARGGKELEAVAGGQRRAGCHIQFERATVGHRGQAVDAVIA